MPGMRMKREKGQKPTYRKRKTNHLGQFVKKDAIVEPKTKKKPATTGVKRKRSDKPRQRILYDGEPSASKRPKKLSNKSGQHIE